MAVINAEINRILRLKYDKGSINNLGRRYLYIYIKVKYYIIGRLVIPITIPLYLLIILFRDRLYRIAYIINPKALVRRKYYF